MRSGGKVVGQVEGDVGGNHRRERDARQVEALGRQLRADQDVDPPVAEVVVDRLEPAPRGQRVGVEARDPQPREARAQLRLDPLGAGAEVADPRAAARRAALGGRRVRPQ